MRTDPFPVHLQADRTVPSRTEQALAALVRAARAYGQALGRLVLAVHQFEANTPRPRGSQENPVLTLGDVEVVDRRRAGELRDQIGLPARNPRTGDKPA